MSPGAPSSPDHDRGSTPSFQRLTSARDRDDRGLALSPQDANDLELLAALKDGRIDVDRLGDEALDRLFALMGTDGVAGFVAARMPERSAPGARETTRVFRLVAHVVSIAAAIALFVGGGLLVTGDQGDLAESRRFAKLTEGLLPRPDSLGEATWRQREKPATTDLRPALDIGARGGSEEDRFTTWRSRTLLIGEAQHATAFVLRDSPDTAITSYRAVALTAQIAALRGESARIPLQRLLEDAGERLLVDAGTGTLVHADLERDLAAIRLDEPRAGDGFELAAADPVDGQVVHAVGGSGAVGWPVASGRVVRTLLYPDPQALREVGAPRGATFERERTRVAACLTDLGLDRGMTGAPLLDDDGRVNGVTIVAGGDISAHARVSALRAFLDRLPSAPAPVPFDLWTAGAAGSETGELIARTAFRLGFGTGDAALLLQYSARDRSLAWTLYLANRSSESAPPGGVPDVPRGLPGMESRGGFAFDVAFHLQGSARVLARSDGESVLEMWADRDGDGWSDVRWTRADDGWSVELEHEPLLSPLTPAERDRLVSALQVLHR